MKIYWTLESVPELAALPKQERMRVWRWASKQIFKHWQTWVGLIVCGLCAGMGSQVGHAVGLDSSGYVGAGIGGGIGGFIYSQIAIRVALPYIRQEVARHQHYRDHV